MKRFVIFLGCLLVFASCTNGPAVNPDPNHTHADFAVWIEGKQIDFSADQYMSGSSEDPEHKNALQQYLHLHDHNGHVVHRHKPGLTLADFFSSLPGIRYQGTEWKFVDCFACARSAGTFPVKLYVNGIEQPKGAAYVFSDNDKLLITDAADPVELRKQQRMVTDDACLYSRTCPERGDPPTENCVADPNVPCTQ
jgi:hypothetical protein